MAIIIKDIPNFWSEKENVRYLYFVSVELEFFVFLTTENEISSLCLKLNPADRFVLVFLLLSSHNFGATFPSIL